MEKISSRLSKGTSKVAFFDAWNRIMAVPRKLRVLLYHLSLMSSDTKPRQRTAVIAEVTMSRCHASVLCVCTAARGFATRTMTTTYAPPPGPPPTRYDPPPGPPPPAAYLPPPLRIAEFPLLSPANVHSLSTLGFTTFPIKERAALYQAASSLFELSKQFFSQPQSDKGQFIVKDANAQGSEEGWSRVVGEKELLTLRRSGAMCPTALNDTVRSLWEECGQLMTEVIRGIERSLDLPPHSLDPVVIPECTMPQAGADRVETLLRMFRYERRSEEEEAVSYNSELGKGRLVAEPHRDLGILSLVIGSSPGLEVWNTSVGNWIPIEQPPYITSSPGELTATLLVGETLTQLTNGRYFPGRHRVFVPSFKPPSIAEAPNSHSQYRYSLVFALRPHSSAVISTASLTSPITGPHRFPMEGVKAGDLFAKIARSHWNINTGKKEREAQRMRLQGGSTLISANAGTAEQSTPNRESDQRDA